MTGIKGASDDQVEPKRQLSKEEMQREQAQEARFGSFEHGAPETGPGEELAVDDIGEKNAGLDK